MENITKNLKKSSKNPFDLYGAKPKKPFISINDYLKEKLGGKAYKINVDGGFTCPNRDGVKAKGGCIYCSNEHLTPHIKSSDNSINAQIDTGIAKVLERHKAEKYIAYFQEDSNTYDSVERLKSLYEEALSHEKISGIAISTRPDCLTPEVIELLQDISKRTLVWVELGLQSAHDETLKYINRAHTVVEFTDGYNMLKDAGINVCIHLIMGLSKSDNQPETREEMLQTIEYVANLKPWGVKFHQLQVVKNTILEKKYEKGLVSLLSLEEYSEIVVEAIKMLPKDTIIHRLSGDTPKKMLVTPNWGGNKHSTNNYIKGLLEAK